MGWPFLFLVRQVYHGDNNWGTLYMPKFGDLSEHPEWARTSYTYELPWKANSAGHSLSKRSQIDIGTYEMHVRTEPPKGWRLELEGTHPRQNIQVHRAHKSMYIEGCILPVTINRFGGFLNWQKGDEAIQALSEMVMSSIRDRYEQLAKVKTGKPTITISAILPASVPGLQKSAYA
jgi:hypothetical protein